MFSQFDQILGSFPLPIIGTDASGRVSNWNSAAERAFGWSQVEALGKICPAVPEGETENYLRIIRRAMQGETVTKCAISLTTKSNSRLVCSTSAAPQRNEQGNPIGITFIFEDILNRRYADGQLIYQAQWLDKVNDAVITADENYVITLWNHTAEEMYGWKPEEALGRNTVELLKSEFLNHSRTEVQKQLREAGEWSGEIIQRRRDGTQIFVHASSIALRDEAGRVVGYLSINRDITERKQVEAALREYTEFMQNVLENSPAAIYITGVDNRLRLVNRAWEHATGWTRADVIDRPLDQIFPVDTAEKFQHDNQRVIETGVPYEYEESLGSRHYLTVKFPLYDRAGIITSVGGISIDITARRQAEEALQHTEALLRMVLQNVPLTIFATDRNGIFTMTEGRGLERVGLQSSQHADLSALQMYGRMPILLQDGETVDGQEVIQRALAGETITAFVEMSGIYFENHVAPLYDAEGNINGIVGVAMDITDRKRAEGALRQSEQKYRDLVELTHDLIWSVDREGRITYVSPAARHIYGREPEEMIGHLFSDFVPEEQAHSGYATLEKAMKTGNNYTNNTSRVYHRDGREIILSTKVVVLKDETGAFTGLVGTSQDITAKVQAEEALRASEKLWRTIFAAANDAILVLDEGYNVIAHNEAAEKMYGAPPTGLNLIDLRAAESRGELGLQMQRVIRENGGRFESVHVRSDGSTFQAGISSKPFESDGKQRFIQIIRDITEHKQLEENLRKAELQYRTLVEQVPPIIYTTGMDQQHTGVTYISPRINMLGFTQGEWLADPGLWFRQMHPEDRERVSHELEQIRESNQARALEYRLAGRDGTVRWFRDESRDVFDNKGIFLFRQGIMLDITATKETEEMLRLHSDRLAALSRQLLKVRETEQRTIGRELHDQIGQMLTAIKITLDMLPQLPAESTARKIGQAQEIVEELLNRVSRLSLKLRPPMLDDQGLLPALLWHIRHYQDQTGLQVLFSHNGLKGRRFDFETETTGYRVVQEALTNIARHARATFVKIDVLVSEGQIEIQIEDDGMGFDPVDAYKKNRGLAGMRERVNLLSGRVWIESKQGGGTHISIRLPVEQTVHD